MLLLPLLASAAHDVAALDQALEPMNLPKITVAAAKTRPSTKEPGAQRKVYETEGDTWIPLSRSCSSRYSMTMRSLLIIGFCRPDQEPPPNHVS